MYIECKNLKLHNLKNIDVQIPLNKLISVTGVSGSGKSTLAFDIIAKTGQERYLSAIGDSIDKQDMAEYNISGLIPTVSISQNIKRQSNVRSTVGSKTGILKLLQSVFAQVGREEYKQELVPAMFSSNSALGMCYNCYGRGHVAAVDEKSIFRHYMECPKPIIGELNRNLRQPFKQYCKLKGVDAEQPFINMPTDIKEAILYGDNEIYFKGTIPYLKECGAFEKDIDNSEICPICGGAGLRKESLNIRILDKDIFEYRNISIFKLCVDVEILIGRYKSNQIVSWFLSNIYALCKNLCQFNLGYLNLDRKVMTLSGGEFQRLLMCSYFNIGLNHILYVFDEPTLGLHVSEKRELLKKIKELVNKNNTVMIVEHDDDVLKLSDYIIEMGPGGGSLGGSVVFSGNKENYIKENFESKLENDAIYVTDSFNRNDKKIIMKDVNTHNLKNVTVEIPLYKLVGVVGVSGSGKSALISQTLVSMLNGESDNCVCVNLGNSVIENSYEIKKTMFMSQKPIGRNKKSIVSSYMGIMDYIREIYLNESKMLRLNYKIGHFSFNSEGACKKCAGEGTLIIAGINCICNECEGSKYDKAILEVLFKGLNIVEILNVTIDEAIKIFDNEHKITNILKSMSELGLGYLTLGQSTKSISGGEAQRLKLALELNNKKSKDYLYILDEPSAGLSSTDIRRLLCILKKIVKEGNSVIIVEHDIQMITMCDWIIEVGPGSGDNGGNIIAEGCIKDIIKHPNSIIGEYCGEYKYENNFE